MTTSAARWYPITILIVATIGFIDATYLTVQHFVNFALPCNITHGCDIVTKSAYSDIGGIPVALLGAIYYAVILLSTYLLLEFDRRDLLKWIAAATAGGFLFSGWFVYVQLFLLHAICQYCMLSAITSTTLFTASVVYLVQQKKN
jgi:uncharacterized membrane protein